MENSRFKIQDPSLQKSLPEKQEITTLYHGVRCHCTIGYSRQEQPRVNSRRLTLVRRRGFVFVVN
jgi:hypothetical protein